MVNSNYVKNTFTFGNTMKFNDWLSSSAKISYANSKSNRIQQGSNTAGIYLGLLRNPADFDISDYIGTYYDANGNPTPLRHRSYRRYLATLQTQPIITHCGLFMSKPVTRKLIRFIGSMEFNINCYTLVKFCNEIWS